ncbi:MAG: hypothetical protein Ct9H300mP21_06100 [Pseudomonadota bacterium]|nr:MAG: hypothetical protein Ct9H300mP21_06100 [Pseudomonadota bacterium]
MDLMEPQAVPTPQSAVHLMMPSPGDHIYIREGRYSELLTKWQLNHSFERGAPKNGN